MLQKRVEEPVSIVERVKRAGLEMNSPEDEDLIKFVTNQNVSPKNKLYKVQQKLRNTKFLQSDLDEFLSTQELDRSLLK